MAATGKKNGKTVVVALGGNAILQPGQVGTFEEQLFNIDGAMRRIAQLVEDGWRVVLTHGNGPQVGNLLIQNALAAKTVAPMPMDVCGAESQGQIGYMAAQTLANHLRKRRLEVPVVTIVTQVAVDPKDKAFASPSKPVGPFYSEAEAKKMMLEEGTAMREDAGRGWRRVVPSPEPKEIVELEAVRDLSDGGLPRRLLGRRRRAGGAQPRRPLGHRRGDRQGPRRGAARHGARRRRAAHPHRRAPGLRRTTAPRSRRRSRRVTASEMRAYAAEGHFKAGSMGPKVEACLRFVDAGGESVIASLTEVGPAMAGKAGTHIVPDAAAKAAKPRADGKAGRSAEDVRRRPPARRRRRPPSSPRPGSAATTELDRRRRRHRHHDRPAARAAE